MIVFRLSGFLSYVFLGMLRFLRLSVVLVAAACRARVARGCLALVAFAFSGCSDKYQAQFSVKPGAEIRVGGEMQVGLSLRYPPTDDLRFVWRATEGKCEPSETHRSYSTFFAPSYPTNVIVSVAVVDGAKTIFVGSLPLHVVSVASNASVASTPVVPAGPKHEIRITSADLPFDEFGGEDTSTAIAGVVAGPSPQRYRVVLYVLTDSWYVQPLVAAPYTDVDSEGKWSAWIHTGKSYAALLVDKGDANFRPVGKIAEVAFAAICSTAVDTVQKPGLRRAQPPPP